jgi:amidohydrolase
MTDLKKMQQPILNFHAQLVGLRRELHAVPELSGREHKTAGVIKEFFRQFNPDRVIAPLGGTGMAFLFDGRRPGPTVVFRCELDAVAIQEENDFAHRSKIAGVSHQCGHDGHMAIMTGLGYLISLNRPERGRIILLFQPAEETGRGAAAVADDPKFKDLNADYVFALHNLPGYPLGALLIRPGPINCASCGMVVRLTGRSSHAAWPQDGLSPALPMCELIEALAKLPLSAPLNPGYRNVTVVHARLGDPAFGLSPGNAQVMATLRSETDKGLSMLAEEAVGLAKGKALAAGLGCEIDWTEAFAAGSNDPGACEIVKKAGMAAGAEVIYLKAPLPVSEDFGQFSARVPGAMFGLGAGEDRARLHQAEYDFPEQLIGIGAAVFNEIAKILVY